MEDLERALASAGVKPEGAAPLIADLLQLPAAERYPIITLPPEQRRRRLLAALTGWVFGAARLQPTVIVVEDIQWLDPSTQELVRLLAERALTAPVMLICTARPEFHRQWPMSSHHTQMTLNRLSARNVREMVNLVAASNALTSKNVEAIVERTAGVPLFVEELTRAVLERGDARTTVNDIPETLHDLLMARLDRLGPSKEVIQIGAAIGSEFSYGLLHAVHPITEMDLQRALQIAADSELIYVRGTAPHATYEFKHALIRDAAYGALLKSRRRELHRTIAQAIVANFPLLKNNHPGMLAQHWTDSGEAEPAVAAWKNAGDAARSRSAFKEAEEAYERALAIIGNLPESPVRDAHELHLARRLLQVLYVTRGYSAREIVETIARVGYLAEKRGNLGRDVLQRFATFGAVCVSGDLPSASSIADELLDLARRDGTETSFAIAHHAQLHKNLYGGNLAGAEEHFAAWNRFNTADGYKQIAGTTITTLAQASYGASILGYPDLARERIVRAMAFAEASHNPYELAFARFYRSLLSLLLREATAAEADAGYALTSSEEHGFPYVNNLSRVVTGWARAHLGNLEEGISLIHGGLAGIVALGARLGVTLLRTCLAEAHLLAGNIDDAINAIDEALQENPAELIFRPAALRVRAEIQLQVGHRHLAEATLRESIALAQSMFARSLELRTAISLARLLRDIDRWDEAYQTLSDIFNWFTEGFDTADLKDAKALLDELRT